MTRAPSIAAALLAGVLVSACAPAPSNTSDRFFELGTMIEVTVRDDDDAQAAFRTVRRVLGDAQRDWYAWNDAGAARLDAHGLLDRAMAIRDLSGGLFEPEIGALVELWGFHRGERAPGPPPSAQATAGWRELPVTVDLGAIAKGAAIAAALDSLSGDGVEHALVNAGGDLAVLGDAGGRPWRIGIRDPRGPGVIAGVELAPGEAVFTSGDYERVFEWDGERYHHILDPRTGRPARGTASVTVIHEDATLADAAATALFVAGADDWRRIAGELGVTQVMRIATDGGIEMTPAMAERLEFEDAADR